MPGYATRNGRQMAAARVMLNPARCGIDLFCQGHTTSNLEPLAGGPRRGPQIWLLCAAGSRDPIGYLFGATTLYERPQGYFSAQGCASP